MSFPTGWGRKCALVIQSSKVDANQVNFPVLLTKDTLPSEMFDADGSYPALSGGGDIRFSSDSAGDTQLACEVVTSTIDNDPANGVAEIWVKVPSISSSSNTTIYVWYHKSGESQPAIDNAYGAENVWDSNFIMVQHMNDATTSTITDSTSNSNDGTKKAANEPIEATGKIGKGQDFDGSASGDDYITPANMLVVNNTSWSISAWIRSSGIGTIFGEGYNGNTSWALLLQIDPNSPYSARIIFKENATWKCEAKGTTAINDDAIHYIVGTQASKSSRSVYVDGGAVEGTNTDLLGDMSILNTCHIGILERSTFGTSSDGWIDEVRVSNIARSVEWMGAEYKNQSDPGTFVIEGTPEIPALAMGAGSFALTGADVDLLLGRSLNMNAGSFTFTGADIDLLRGRLLAMDSGSFVLTGANINLIYLITYLLAMDSGSFTLTGADIDLLVDRYLSMNAGSFTFTGANINLLRNRFLAMDSGSFTLTGADIGLFFNRLLSMDSGEFILTGTDITFTRSGLPIGRMKITFTPRKPGITFTPRI